MNEPETGVKWKWKSGWSVSHSLTAAVECVEKLSRTTWVSRPRYFPALVTLPWAPEGA